MGSALNEKWVDDRLVLLSERLDRVRARHREFFEPTESFYALLNTGEESDLSDATDALCTHAELEGHLAVCYEWGLRMGLDAAGMIARQRASTKISIPFQFVGRPPALGAILAHEISHAVLFHLDFPEIYEAEKEPFTDLAAVFLGFGKLLLNGIQVLICPTAGQGVTLGYLGPDLIAYAFRRIVADRHVLEDLAHMNLNDAGLRLVALPKRPVP